MGAPDLLHALRDQGLKLWVDGDRLLVAPKERITDETRALIREHKAELLAELKVSEFVRCLRLYAKCNRFSQADFDEALQVAMAGDVDGWIAYIQSQNATLH